LGEVLARKPLEQGGGFREKREREIKSALKRCSKVMFLRLIRYLWVTLPLFAYPFRDERYSLFHLSLFEWLMAAMSSRTNGLPDGLKGCFASL
jgi:hypothetical protein